MKKNVEQNNEILIENKIKRIKMKIELNDMSMTEDRIHNFHKIFFLFVNSQHGFFHSVTMFSYHHQFDFNQMFAILFT